MPAIAEPIKLLTLQELVERRTVAAISCLDRLTGNPTQFWHNAFSGKDPEARMALTDNTSLYYMAAEAPNYGNPYDSYSEVKWAEKIKICRKNSTLTLGTVVEDHYLGSSSEKQLVFKKIMTTWEGKNMLRKATRIHTNGEIGNQYDHFLVPVNKEWCLLVNDLNVASPDKEEGTLFHQGRNTSLSVYKAAMTICHIQGRTDSDSYNAMHRRMMQHLINTASPLLHSTLTSHANSHSGAGNMNNQRDNRQGSIDGQYMKITANSLAPWGVDRLAVWVTWDKSTKDNLPCPRA